jgi:hypothetical protein
MASLPRQRAQLAGRFRLSQGAAAALFTGLVAGQSVHSAAGATLLYSLATWCSLNGTKAVACRVDAIDEGEATIYRHRIGSEERLVRIREQPLVRIELWDAASRQWRSARSAAALLRDNVLCFDGTALCVLNPNYLNSVREEKGQALAGRETVQMTFGADGRVNAYCYDDGCPSPPAAAGARP